MSMSYCVKQRLNRWRMLVLFATISPLTLCAEGAYGDFLESATCSKSKIIFADKIIACCKFLKGIILLEDSALPHRYLSLDSIPW